MRSWLVHNGFLRFQISLWCIYISYHDSCRYVCCLELPILFGCLYVHTKLILQNWSANFRAWTFTDILVKIGLIFCLKYSETAWHASLLCLSAEWRWNRLRHLRPPKINSVLEKTLKILWFFLAGIIVIILRVLWAESCTCHNWLMRTLKSFLTCLDCRPPTGQNCFTIQ